MNELSEKFTGARYRGLSIDTSTGKVCFEKAANVAAGGSNENHAQFVNLQQKQAQIFSFIIDKAGSPYFSWQLRKVFSKVKGGIETPMSENSFKVQLSKIRKALRSISLSKNVSLDSVILTDRMVNLGYLGNANSDIYLNTELLNAVYLGLPLGGVRTDPIIFTKFLSRFVNGSKVNFRGIFNYAGLVLNTEEGHVQFGDDKTSIPLFAGQLLALMIKNPTAIYSVEGVERELKLDEGQGIKTAESLRYALQKLSLGNNLKGRSAFLMDKIFDEKEQEFISPEVYLNTKLLDALSARKSIEGIRIQHMGRENII